MALLLLRVTIGPGVVSAIEPAAVIEMSPAVAVATGLVVAVLIEVCALDSLGTAINARASSGPAATVATNSLRCIRNGASKPKMAII